MKEATTIELDAVLTNALVETLLKRIPPKTYSLLLKDLIQALMEALLKGEVYISLNEADPPIGVTNKGWPTEHHKALLKSGWVDGNDSPMILKEENLSWRRWHIEMETSIQELVRKSMPTLCFYYFEYQPPTK